MKFSQTSVLDPRGHTGVRAYAAERERSTSAGSHEALFDQNAHLLVDRLATCFGSVHVQTVGLERATDVDVWEHAKTHD
jgi:hypothetical protein